MPAPFSRKLRQRPQLHQHQPQHQQRQREHLLLRLSRQRPQPRPSITCANITGIIGTTRSVVTTTTTKRPQLPKRPPLVNLSVT